MDKLDMKPIKEIYRRVLNEKWRISIVDNWIALINPKNNDVFIWSDHFNLWICL